MSYATTIEQHEINSWIEKLDVEIAVINEMETKTAEETEAIGRISQIVSSFKTSYRNCEKNLISITWLTESAKAMSSLVSYLNTFCSNKNISYLTTSADTHLDVLLNTTVKFNCIRNRQSLVGASAAFDSYAQTMNLQLRQYESTVAELTEKMSASQLAIDTKSQEFSATISALESKVTEEKQRLDNFGAKYQEQMGKDQTTFSDMLTSLKEKFLVSQEENKENITDSIAILEKRHSDIEEKSKQAITDFSESCKLVIKENEDAFKAYQEQVKAIVGVANSNVFSFKYKEVADDAHKRARFWHFIAVVLMMFVGGFAVYAFVITANQDTSWVKLVAKIFATTTLVTGAAYSARQASKQEKVERYARKIEMELVAIDPFIESLDVERRAQIKEEISRKLFGNPDAMEINSKDEAHTALEKLNSIEEIKSILSLIAKIPK